MFREKLRIRLIFLEKSSEIWPKRLAQIVVWVEGENGGTEKSASTASEYPLADIALFRSPARTVKIACGGAGLRWRPQSVKRFEALTEPTGETPDPYEKRRLPMANRKRNIQMKFYFYGSAI